MGKTIASVTMMTTAAFVPGPMSGPPAQAQILPVPLGVAGNINGVACYTGMSGISAIKGTVTADGTITPTLTSISGNGPAGNVTGRRDNNISHVELHGAGCANAKFDLQRWPQTGGGGV